MIDPESKAIPVSDAKSGEPQTKPLSPQAQRALAEAAQRRIEQTVKRPHERDGPSGAEPTRYGDWERKGIAYDF